jgi:hypothetical protein
MFWGFKLSFVVDILAFFTLKKLAKKVLSSVLSQLLFLTNKPDLKASIFIANGTTRLYVV